MNREAFKTFSNYAFQSYTINVKRDADNVIFLKSEEIFRVKNILMDVHSKSVFFYGYKLREQQDAETYPEPSSKVGIYEVTDVINSRCMKEILTVDQFSTKCVAIPTIGSKMVAMCTLH